MKIFELLQGDCRQVLATLPAGSVQCCITSPPYWGLRDYGTAGQLGLEPTPEQYVANMVSVFREVWRVLRDDGTLWVNLGDSYSSTGGSNAKQFDIITTGHKKLRDNGAVPDYTRKVVLGLKPKDLVGIPWRVAFALQADGWYLRQDIIWHKPNPMPEGVTDRCTKAHEYIFLLTKSARYFYDNEAVKERGVMVAGDSAGSSQRDTQETHGLGGGNSGINLAKQKLAAELRKNGYSMRNKRSVWTVTIKPFKGAHFATFPPDLIEPCILAGSAAKCCAVCYAPWERVVEQGLPAPEPAHRNPTKRLEPGQAGNADAGNMGFRASKLSGQEMSKWKAENPDRTVGWEPRCECGGETQPSMVLDPFSGAGTTGVVAVQHGRRYIGIELNPDYLEMSRKRIQRTIDGTIMPLF